MLGLTRARMSKSWCYVMRSVCCAARSPVRDPPGRPARAGRAVCCAAPDALTGVLRAAHDTAALAPGTGGAQVNVADHQAAGPSAHRACGAGADAAFRYRESRLGYRRIHGELA